MSRHVAQRVRERISQRGRRHAGRLSTAVARGPRAEGAAAGAFLKLIAQDVGYGSEAALSRAFKAQSGQSPRDWRKAQLDVTRVGGRVTDSNL